MKRKFLVPVMAIAITVMAGVNYKMVSESNLLNDLSLCVLVKCAFAEPIEFGPLDPPDQTLPSDTTDDNDGWETDILNGGRICAASGGGCN